MHKFFLFHQVKSTSMFQVDIPRALRSLLDLAFSDTNPNLERWAASCISHLIVEEEPLTTSPAKVIASMMAMERDFDGNLPYQSFLLEFWMQRPTYLIQSIPPNFWVWK